MIYLFKYYIYVPYGLSNKLNKLKNSPINVIDYLSLSSSKSVIEIVLSYNSPFFLNQGLIE